MFKWENIKIDEQELYYENFQGCFNIKWQIEFITKIPNFREICNGFNGCEVLDSYFDNKFIKFKNVEDAEKCCEYLNSLLVLDKLIGG